MASLNLKGYNINFPYPTPYDLQKAYMEKVLTCLDQKTHAVLESPTGTGKTLCLFAPITAWTKHKKQQVNYVQNEAHESNTNLVQRGEKEGNWGKKRSKVWYTSRTHAQIAQTISEVRKCDTEGLQVTVMGARDQLCINKIVVEEKDSYIKTIKCKELLKNKNCKYHKRLSHEKDIRKYYQGEKVLDIEDLVSTGKSHGLCPYFMAKRACETADIVLLPYNYVIDRDSREANSVFLHNDIIIFDEGHNIPNTCEESYEFSFTSLNIALGIRNTKDLMLTLSKLSEKPPEEMDIDLPMHAKNAVFMMSVLQKLEVGLEELPTTNELYPVSAIYSFFENAEISEKTSRDLVDAINNFKNDSFQLNLSNSILETFKLLEKMMHVVFGPVVKSFDEKTIEQSFKCAITIDTEHATNIKKFSLFCFNPSFGIRELLQSGVQSIIITSGTLSPLKTFITELNLPNPVTLENGHMAKKCQVPFVILGTGVNNVRMDGAYKNRNDPEYVLSLGMTLTNLISSIPDGILLLFSSYTMMQNLKEAWESNMGVWSRLNSLKRVFVEPRGKDDFINAIENYKRAIDAGNGAILMGVLRGKISEGMDFKDQYCRGVFIIGVPFPPINDPRVKGKERYSESLTIKNPITNVEEKLYTDYYMSVEAMRATNQAIGRVIRHGQDYGAVILVDYRFSWPRLFCNISKWLRGDTAVSKNFPTTKKLIRDFFKDIHLGKIGVEEIRCQRVDSNGCPIASNISFEEYDHKKHAPQPFPWIGESVDEFQSQSTSKSQASKRGRNNFEFIDEESPKDLVSKYKNMSTKVFMYGKKLGDWEGSTSLLDALEQSMSSSVGYREFDKNNHDSCKRKLEDDSTHKSNAQTSPSMLMFPSAAEKRNKIPKIKVRPLVPFDNCESHSAPPDEPQEDEDLKMQLINYYKTVKRTLSKDHEQRFKNISCRYMKGEASLLEVIESMDELFLTSGEKNLFSGFGICVKGKDKELWKNACKMREVKCEFRTSYI